MKTTVKVAWKDLKFGAKETTISLIIKGDPTDDQILTLTRLKSAGSGFATLGSDQMDIDDFNHDEPRNESAGLEDPNQTSLDDVTKEPGAEAEGSEAAAGSEEGSEGGAESSKEESSDDQPASDSEKSKAESENEELEGKVASLEEAKKKRSSSRKKRTEQQQPEAEKQPEGSEERPTPADDDDDNLPF